MEVGQLMASRELFEVVPVEKITTPKAGSMMVYVDSWWICDKDGNPVFRNSRPLCNPYKQIAEQFLNKRLGLPEYKMLAKIVQIPLAMVSLADMGY